MTKNDLKTLRDQSIEQWSFTSHQVPFWLQKQTATLIKLCQQQPVHGLIHQWLPSLIACKNRVPQEHEHQLDLSSRAIQGFLSQGAALIEQHLQQLKPWRHGPWAFNDTLIESEWDCSIKYQRLQHFGPCFANKKVLDIGCSNGYYGLRMLGDGAQYVLGVDPSFLAWIQFSTFKMLQKDAAIDLLPMACEPLASFHLQFDIVLSMGILYHRKNPVDHLKLLKHCLIPGGELVLETLIIDGADEQILVPSKSYAGMANVWGLPSLGLLKQWLSIAGFTSIECVSLSITTLHEQRKTPWINTHSLNHFLSACATKTIEGYRAPWRAIVRASF